MVAEAVGEPTTSGLFHKLAIYLAGDVSQQGVAVSAAIVESVFFHCCNVAVVGHCQQVVALFGIDDAYVVAQTIQSAGLVGYVNRGRQYFVYGDLRDLSAIG